MDRRTLLGAVAGGLLGLAGCADRNVTSTATQATPPPTPTTTPMETPPAEPTATRTEAPSTPTPAPDAVRIIALEARTQVQIGEAVTVRVTVQNAGENPRSFAPTLSLLAADGTVVGREGWEPVPIEPGGLATFETAPITRDYLTTLAVRVDGFDETIPLSFVARRLGFSRPFRDPLGREITVTGIGARGAYTYTSGGGAERRVEAGDGRQWVLATVEVTNRSTRSVAAPSRTAFTLRAGPTTYQPVAILGDGGYDPSRLARRESVRGRIGFNTPDDLALPELAVRWSESFAAGEVAAVWGRG